MADKITPPKGKTILDATCGSRTIWFDKHHPSAIYMDKRAFSIERRFGIHNSLHHLNVSPDVVADFTDIPYVDDSFSLVVFDPPHILNAKNTAWISLKYGSLDENWRDMIRDGFRECMRVLKPGGVLIFKWSEVNIPAIEVWKAIGDRPLFGHHSGKKSNTYWGAFMKEDANGSV